MILNVTDFVGNWTGNDIQVRNSTFELNETWLDTNHSTDEWKLSIDGVVVETVDNPSTWIEMALLAALLFVVFCSSLLRGLRPGVHQSGFTWRTASHYEMRMEPTDD